MNPSTAFRPTDLIQNHIEQEQEKNPTKKKSDIIIELCEQAISYSEQKEEEKASSLQIEREKKIDKEEFFNLPQCLLCPIVKAWVLRGELLGPKGCEDCLEKRDCPAWNKNKAMSFELPSSKSRSYRIAHTVPY